MNSGIKVRIDRFLQSPRTHVGFAAILGIFIDYLMILPFERSFPFHKELWTCIKFVTDSVLTFNDPASVYSYHSITFHNKLWFLYLSY